jgi:hypothetical protein
MKRRATTVLCAWGWLWLAAPASAQPAQPNAAGVSMGHLHYHVRDVDANKRFWMSLGGTSATVRGTEVIAFPGVFVVLTRAESTGGTDGSVVNHVAFRVQSLEKLRAGRPGIPGIPVLNVQLLAQFPGVGSVTTPEGERIELFDDLSENVKFTLDPGWTDRTAERHNQRMAVPIAAHHIHLFVPEGAESVAKAWYVKTFGAVPGTRWHYAGADLPGINMNFSASKQALAPTKGRMLDHIGFEVRHLAAFCRALEAGGMKFDVPFTREPSGLSRALLTDPWGTSIELTEGFN